MSGPQQHPQSTCCTDPNFYSYNCYPHWPVYSHYNMDVIHTQNSIPLDDFVDPATKTTVTPGEVATSINQCDFNVDGVYCREYYQMGLLSSQGSANVVTMDNTFNEVPYDNHQTESYLTNSNHNHWTTESNNFNPVHYEQIQYLSSSESNVTTDYTFGEVQQRYHQMQISSTVGEFDDDTIKCVTIGEVQQRHSTSSSDSNYSGNEANHNKTAEDEDDDRKKKFRCDPCGKSYKSLKHLKQHNKSKHDAPDDPNTILRCDPCGKVFSKLGYLKQHNSARHDADKQYKCKRCMKGFCTKDERDTHFAKHFGIKPFPCLLCNKTFHYSTDLRRHSRKHTADLFFCEDCGRGFSRMSHLKDHRIRKHLIREFGNTDGEKV